jgi:osmotically-inducible protein OsmY
MEVDMAYRDYEFDRDYGNRGSWRGRGEYDRDRWYGGGYGAGGYGAGGYGDWDRGWNRSSYGGWGTGATNPDYNYSGNYGRGEPWYGGGYGSQGMERGYGNQNFERGYGYGGSERGYPGYGGYGYGGYTGSGYGGGYGNNAGEWRGGSAMGYESGTSRYQGRQNQGNWQQQNYSGRGPRNYQRSDDRIEEDVNEALTRHPGLDASEIEVRVQNGEVTLTGTVDSRQDKRMAEDAAESCAGVRDVHNQLRVSSAGSRNAEREVTRTPAQEGRTSGESRGGSRQTTSSRSSK